MPVYTVHAPAVRNADLRSIDSFAFVRDGFHVWAALLGPVWLAWHRLWLALIGWIVLVVGLDLVIVKFAGGGIAVLAANFLIALLMGFEAASLWRWTLSRRNWRQLDIVVGDNREAAEQRFFDRWTTRQRAPPIEFSSIDRGASPPPLAQPPHGDIIGLFPQPGA